MATPAHRSIRDQNLNVLYKGTPLGGKTDLASAKADKKGGFGVRKALNDISNARKLSVLQSTKKENSTKGKTGARKALGDLTNSVKPFSTQKTIRKLHAVAEENVPSSIAEEGFLHDHEKCIKAQMEARHMDMSYFLKSVGLANDIPVELSAVRPPKPTSKKHENLDLVDIDEFEDEVFPAYYYSPVCRSPKSPTPPYGNWDNEKFADLVLMESPQSTSHS